MLKTETAAGVEIWKDYDEYAKHSVVRCCDDNISARALYPTDRKVALEMGYERYIVPNTKNDWRTEKISRTIEEKQTELMRFGEQAAQKVEITYLANQKPSACNHDIYWKDAKKIREAMKGASDEDIFAATRLPMKPCSVPGCNNFYCKICEREGNCIVHNISHQESNALHIVGLPAHNDPCWMEAVMQLRRGYTNVWIIPKYD